MTKWPESKEPKKGDRTQPLRTGLTTGCCATACAIAAFKSYLSGKPTLNVEVELPSKKSSNTDTSTSKVVALKIDKLQQHESGATAYTTKDAGDDPDVTHGASVWVNVTCHQGPQGVRFLAGEGVGTVTKSGLPLDVGEPAINPVPREMITAHLLDLAENFGYTGEIAVTVGVINGAALATKTMNPKLGIVGGLSILGTTGIVRPFSCSAYIASIHQGIDVAMANNQTHLLACTGNQSENVMREQYPEIDGMAYIEMGDFVGALLKHLRSKSKKSELMPQALTVCGGFGKLSKLAEGHMDLHSRVSTISFEQLHDWAMQLGAPVDILAHIKSANTSIEALNTCLQANINLADKVCELSGQHIRKYVPYPVALEVIAINRQGKAVGRWSDHGNG